MSGNVKADMEHAQQLWNALLKVSEEMKEQTEWLKKTANMLEGALLGKSADFLNFLFENTTFASEYIAAEFLGAKKNLRAAYEGLVETDRSLGAQNPNDYELKEWEG